MLKDCFCRGPGGLVPASTSGTSQLPVTLVLEELMPSCGSYRHLPSHSAHKLKQAHAQIKDKNANHCFELKIPLVTSTESGKMRERSLEREAV